MYFAARFGPSEEPLIVDNYYVVLPIKDLHTFVSFARSPW
jgi:hypothetical protein